MRIKSRTRERTIKLRNTEKAAEQAFRRTSIKHLIKSARTADTQTAEGDAVDETEAAAASTLQRVGAIRHNISQKERKSQQQETKGSRVEPNVDISAESSTRTAPIPTTRVSAGTPTVLQAKTSDGVSQNQTTISPNTGNFSADAAETAHAPLRHIGSKPGQVKAVPQNTQIPAPATVPHITDTIPSATPSPIQTAQGATLKLRQKGQAEVKTPATTIQPKVRTSTAKQNATLVSRWKAVRHGPQPQKAAAAQAAAAKKVTKTGKLTKVLKEVLTTSVKSIGHLGAMLFGGAAGILIPLLLVALIGGLLCSPLGIFFSSEADNELTIQTVLTQLNTEFNERITEIENTVAHDDVQQSGSQASQKDILAVYAVKITTDPDNPLDAVTMDEQRAEILREIFWAMNQIDYTTETYTEEETIQVPNEASDAEEGDMIEQTQTVERTRLLITITGKTAEEMATEYGFTQEQLSYLTELLSDDYTELWYGLPFGTGSGSDDLVAVALSQLGTAGGRPYWSWYGFSYRVAWCACFVSWCADQCGYIDSGLVPKFSYCDNGIAWFKAQGRWQGRNYVPAPGDIIFFDWGLDGVSDHVGIVESCDGTTVYTIEGNANDNVKQLSYAVGYSKIMGYGVISP